MDEGCAHILKSELHRWYDKKKIAARTYRDLEERWQEISEGQSGPLHRVWGAGGVFLLASDRVQSLAEEPEEE
jgi:hypothetical protein